MLLELHIVPFTEHVIAVIICFRYGSPILNIKWHQTLNSTEPKLITADKHIVRVWDPNTVSSLLSILFKCCLHYYHIRFDVDLKQTLTLDIMVIL